MRVQLWWHVALMGSWRVVVPEQIAMFQRVCLRPMVGVLGPGHRTRLPIIGDIVYRSHRISEYETPTIQKLWEWCKALPDPSEVAILYCHTKGVSKPSPQRTAWRKLMEKWVVERWRENLPLLDDHDILGVSYRPRNETGNFTAHFAGNFWMARADWINKLVPPLVHRNRLPSFRRRYSPEMWPLSTPGYRTVSLCCENVLLGKGRNVFRMLQVPLPESG